MTSLEDTWRSDPGRKTPRPGFEVGGKSDLRTRPSGSRRLEWRGLPASDRAMEYVIAVLSPDPNGDPVIRKGISDIVLADAWPDCGHPRPQKLTERRLNMKRKRRPTEAQARGECERIIAVAQEEYERAIAPVTAERERIMKEAWAERERKGAQATAEYHRTIAPSKSRYEGVSNFALARRERIVAKAKAKYKRVTGREFGWQVRFLPFEWDRGTGIEALPIPHPDLLGDLALPSWEPSGEAFELASGARSDSQPLWLQALLDTIRDTPGVAGLAGGEQPAAPGDEADTGKPVAG